VRVDISLQWEQGRGARPGLIVQGRQGEKEIGTCECVSAGEYSRSEEAQDWSFTTGLDIAEEMQGKGLGRFLLQRALEEMHGIGYRHAAISTGWRNFRAFLFYSNCGYHVVDWTYGLRRELKAV
jgi:GNAT superfamily N-acetyltransferase